MPTFIFTKEKFLEFIKNQVKKDAVIVMSTEKNSTAIYKKDLIKIDHVYERDGFKDDGIGHIAFGETMVMGVLVANKKRISDKGIQLMKEAAKK